VVVIASGMTERRTLPHLLRHMDNEGIELVDVRIPPGGYDLTPDMAERLVRLVCRESMTAGSGLKKVVLLVDADGREPAMVLQRFSHLPARLAELVMVVTTVAKWHLEAWFFADGQGLRKALGKSLGRIEEAVPDDIESPKKRLKDLLGGTYSSTDAEKIARVLSPARIRRSPSFCALEAAVRNGAKPCPGKELTSTQ